MPIDIDIAQTNLQNLPIKPGDRFRHYKGGEYEVVNLALKEDTLEPLIIYRSPLKGGTWARTYNNWTEKVEVNDNSVARFQKIR